MKKKIIITAIIVMLIAAGGVWLADSYGWFYRASPQQKRFMTEMNAANAVVMYYGNVDPGREITINYRKVTDFTEETIGDPDNQYTYHAIVIFDFDGTMDISDEELLLIKGYCENNHYDMLYYGTAHLDQFSKCGFFKEIDSDENRGFTYNGAYWLTRKGQEEWPDSYLLTGNWTKTDDEVFGTKNTHMIWKLVIGYMIGLVEDSMKGELQ